MAIFGNFKGTTTSEFKIGKSSSGSKISTGDQPTANLSVGDLFIDAGNTTVKVYTGSAWSSLGSTLTDLIVDSGTLFVNRTNDTVSIGSTSFPPFTNAEYADVSFKRVVSLDPREIDRISSGFS